MHLEKKVIFLKMPDAGSVVTSYAWSSCRNCPLWKYFSSIRNLFIILLCFIALEVLVTLPSRCSVISVFLNDKPCDVSLNKTPSIYNLTTIGTNETLEKCCEQVTNKSLSLCPSDPPGLESPITVDKNTWSWEELELKFGNLQKGGYYVPTSCTPRHKVAIVIPFRDRESHLKIFINNIHPFLQKQQLEYAIYVVDLYPGPHFNRAMLMNIGFKEALMQHDFQCVVFHDVDLLPEKGLNKYSCPTQPRHMSVAVDTLKYKLPYANIFGGVTAMTVQQFRAVNGYSNKFFRWGGEDDDMFNRIRLNNMTITRYSPAVARYTMLSHKKDEKNPERFNLLKSGKSRRKTDGLNSLKYMRLKLELRKLYTYVLVDINEKEIMSNS